MALLANSVLMEHWDIRNENSNGTQLNIYPRIFNDFL